VNAHSLECALFLYQCEYTTTGMSYHTVSKCYRIRSEGLSHSFKVLSHYVICVMPFYACKARSRGGCI